MLYYSFKLGPYVAAKNPLVSRSESFRCCVSSKCDRNGVEISSGFVNYCSTCGGAIGSRETAVKKSFIDRVSVLGIIDERLIFPLGDDAYVWMRDNERDIWFSNIEIPGLYFSACSSESLFAVISRDADIIKEQLATFGSVFSKELQTLRRIYGNDNVQMHWGAIYFCS